MQSGLATGELDLHLCGRLYQLSFVACDQAPRWQCREENASGYLPVVSTALHIAALTDSLADPALEATAMQPERYAERVWAGCDPSTPAPRDEMTLRLSLAPLLWWTAQSPPRTTEGQWVLGRHALELSPWSYRQRAQARSACRGQTGVFDLGRFMFAELEGCVRRSGAEAWSPGMLAELPCQILKGVEACLAPLDIEPLGVAPDASYARRLFALADALGTSPIALEAASAPELDRLLALAEAAGLGQTEISAAASDQGVATVTDLEADPSATVFYFE